MLRSMAAGAALLVMLVLPFGLGAAPVAAGGVTITPAETLEHIYPTYDRATVATALRNIDVDRDQWMIIDMLITDYMAGLGDLIDRTDQAADAAGRSRVDDVLSGRARVSGDELRSMRIAVLRAYADAWPESDALFEGLEEGILALLLDDQIPPVELIFRELRRDAWMEARRKSDGQPTYAGDGVDVASLARDAADEELRSADPAAIEAILDDYASRMDVLLAEIGPADRQGALDLRIALIRRDAVATAAATEGAAVERWRRLDALNGGTVAAISGLLARPEDRAAWQARVNEASFPWLVRDTLPARQFDWMEDEIDAPRLEQARAIMGDDAARRAALTGEAISIMREGRVRHGRIVHPMSGSGAAPGQRPDPNLVQMQQALLKNSGARTALDGDTSAKLRALLTPDERADMDRRVR